MNIAQLTGYTDRFSVSAGERIEFKISSASQQDYSASLVRIVHGDPNPVGPGLKYEEISDTEKASFTGTYPSRVQETYLGSYAITRGVSSSYEGSSFTFGATIWPTLPHKTEPQAILSRFGGHEIGGFRLDISKDKGASFTLKLIGSGIEDALTVHVGKPMRERTWYRVAAMLDAGTGTLTVCQWALVPEFGVDDSGTTSIVVSDHTLPRFLPGEGGRFVIAAAEDARRGGESSALSGSFGMHFNGKIERPFILNKIYTDQKDLKSEWGDPSFKKSALVSWNFALGIQTQTVSDVGPNHMDAILVNLPTRAMKGSNWSGKEMHWCHAPEEYGAIHFHDDDLYDCCWETDFCFDVPHDFPSGVYGARLLCGDAEDVIPFYVRPKLGMPTASIAFLASTFTYQVYANHARHNTDESYFERARTWGASTSNPDQNSQYGLSTYNYHSDGSGICYSSRLRPILTFRPGFLTFNDARGSGLRHFPADTHLLDWLETMGHNFDVITDEDLHDDGVALLNPYKLVLTGSHPEYYTLEALDALQSYVDTGGRLMYLGGNGFYWRIARSLATPGVLEIRRGEGGIRAWAAEPGEYYHCLDGAYGGLWRRNGRPPQRLVGVGFSSQGLFEGSFYVRTPASYDPRLSWVFKSVKGEQLGNFGLSGGGAAGFELDHIDHRLGTPSNTVVLARSQDHSNAFIPVHEEMLTHISTVTGESPKNLIHADMVFFETANGGCIFSTGSITFCGSLSYNNYDNNISQIMMNVVQRFLSDSVIR